MRAAGERERETIRQASPHPPITHSQNNLQYTDTILQEKTACLSIEIDGR